MVEVWKVLDEEYGNNIDICPEVIGELTSFKFSTRSLDPTVLGALQ